MIENRSFETIFEKVLAKIKQTDFSVYAGISSRGSNNKREIEDNVISDVFNWMLSESGAFVKNGLTGKPEEVVLALIRLGVKKDKIRYRKNQFRIELPNCYFRIYRECSGKGAYPCAVGIGNRCDVTGLAPSELASFALKFDTLIPRIREEVDKMACDWKKAVLADTIRMRTAETIVSNFLKTADVSDSNWKVNEDGTVYVNARIVEVREAQITVPLEELKENLDILKERLEKMPRREVKRGRGYLPDIVDEIVYL